jgi:hypothetical protein
MMWPIPRYAASQLDNFSAWMSKKHKADTLPTAIQKSAS